eukprot:GEMP01029058.1.p1 GENE.GEMP01029058.1~~GEMP01029058.1.p1  ORF type:complete len:522 (+),score=116.03 GEMP01029058.1:58-1623(+)
MWHARAATTRRCRALLGAPREWRSLHSLCDMLPETLWSPPPETIPEFEEMRILHKSLYHHTPARKFQPVPLDVPLPGVTASTSSSVSAPKCRFTKLPHGMRVVSIDRRGASTALGVLLRTGSRFESVSDERGLTHLLELTAFRSTTHLSHMEQAKLIEKLGATMVCQAAREHVLYKMEVLREYFPLAVPILLGNVLAPKFDDNEVYQVVQHIADHQKVIYENKELVMTDLIHQAAYGDKTLGPSVYATPSVNASRLRKFVSDQVTPDNLVVVGLNCDHDELVGWIQRSLSDIEVKAPVQARVMEPAVYAPGYKSLPDSENVELCHIAVAFHLEQGWNSEHLLPLTLLQTLLGGGGSFSTGGPGKGMHSRVYKTVLNQYFWVESCQTFNHVYSDSALFGFYGQVAPDKADHFCKIAQDLLKSLNSFTDEEVTRAKNSLKSSIAMNLETNAVVMEDIGRQLLMLDRVALTSDFHKMIDDITAADLTAAAKEVLKSTPAMAVHGKFSPPPTYISMVDACAKIVL